MQLYYVDNDQVIDIEEFPNGYRLMLPCDDKPFHMIHSTRFEPISRTMRPALNCFKCNTKIVIRQGIIEDV